MRGLRAWLRLVRVGALPTAVADVWLGAAVVGQLASPDVIALSFVSLALYAGGMVLNDVRDVDEDRRHNRTRPLPSGEIGLAWATFAGFALLAMAVGGGAVLGRGPLTVAALLAVLVLGYDIFLKATAVGPLNMGLCRALNVVLGMSAAPGVLGPESAAHLAAAAPVLVYVIGVTYLSRGEASGAPGARGAPRGSRFVPAAAVVAAGLAVCVARYVAWTEDRRPEGLAMLAFLALVVSLTAAMVDRVWRTVEVRRVVAWALVCIIPLEALVAAAHGRVIEGACILLLLVPAFLLGRLSHVT